MSSLNLYDDIMSKDMALSRMGTKRTTSNMIGFKCIYCGSVYVDSIQVYGKTFHVCNDCGHTQ
jgi:DNA-directed RNA polymerase subunit RPC12/RpoP